MRRVLEDQKLSEREELILRLLNDFGFCKAQHIQKRFGIGRSTSYDDLKALKRLALVQHQWVMPYQAGVYCLTRKGMKVIAADLPRVSRIPFNAYQHHLAILQVYLQLIKQYPQAVWISERRLIKQKYEQLSGTKEHLADGILILSDQRRVVIEVELTLKSKSRLLDIFSDYEIDRSVSEVWYFCAPSIINALKTYAAAFSKIKINLLDF